MKKLFSISFFLVSCLLAISAPVAFRGSVFDANSGDIIKGAIIKINGTQFTSQTDEEGVFEMVEIPSGKFDIVVSYNGYDKRSFVNVEFTETQDMSMNIGLFPLQEQTISNTQTNLLNSQATIRGKVVTAEGKPASNVSVQVPELGINTITDENGRYAIRNFQEGVYTLIIGKKKIPNIKMPKRYVINLSL